MALIEQEVLLYRGHRTFGGIIIAGVLIALAIWLIQLFVQGEAAFSEDTGVIAALTRLFIPYIIAMVVAGVAMTLFRLDIRSSDDEETQGILMWVVGFPYAIIILTALFRMGFFSGFGGLILGAFLCFIALVAALAISVLLVLPTVKIIKKTRKG